MKKIITALEKIGLSKEETLIYKFLLSNGPSLISEIVRKTNIHRPTVYKTLPSLIEKELISLMPKGKYKMYVAESPDKLERLFDNLEDDFNSEIYELHEAYSTRGKKPIITFTEGDKAIKSVFSDVVHSLKKGDVYYRYSSSMALSQKKYVPGDYRIIRDKKSSERYIITDESSAKGKPEKLGKFIKTVPNSYNLFDLNITQVIYGNKVALVDYNSKTVLVIENEMIAKFQKKVFKLLYGKL